MLENITNPSPARSLINDFYYQYEEDIDKIIIDGTNEKRRRVYKLFFPKFINPETLRVIEIV